MQKEEQPNEKPAPELIVFTPPPTKPSSTTTDNTVFLVDDQRLEGFSLEDLNPGRTAILKVKKQTAGSPTQLLQIISLDRNQATGVPVQLVALQQKNPEKIDGDRTDTLGSCDCGYKHWFQGKEVDFVIKPSGYNLLLGFNLGDNPYKVAEYFVMQNDQSKNLNHRNMINAVATDIIRRTDRFFQTTEPEKKEEKKSTFDPTKATISIPTKNTTHWNSTTQQIEKTTYLATDEFSKYTPEEVAENVKKLKILEAQRRQQEEEARQRDQDTAHITNLLRRDRMEAAADARLRNEKEAHIGETKTNGSVPVVIDGNIEWVDPSSRRTDTPVKTTTGSGGLRTLKDLSRGHHHHECQDPHHHHHPTPGRLVDYDPEEEDDSDSSDDDDDDDNEDPIFAEHRGHPPKEVWTADMVIKRLRRDIPPYDNTKQLLMACGFTNSESVHILTHVLLHHPPERRLQKRQRTLDQRSHQNLPDPIEVHPRSDDLSQSKSKTPEKKVFTGHGFTLRTWTPEMDSTPSSSAPALLLEVDPNAPKTSLKVRFADNTQVTIEANHNHTVQQLTDHIRALSKVISFKLVNTGSFPPKALTNGSQTIKEANLLNGTIQMSK